MESSLQAALQRVLDMDGVTTVALIDIASGMVVRSAGELDPGFPAAAASVADEARAARLVLGPGLPAGELEEIAVVTGTRLHLAKVLQDKPEEGYLLFVDMDRARVNVALASKQVGQLAPAVLA
ncbi:MAG TPA: hypothetical protein VH478_05355 [Trebonia sp.]|nr:hypothetical protein [Trebonia sp.]